MLYPKIERRRGGLLEAAIVLAALVVCGLLANCGDNAGPLGVDAAAGTGGSAGVQLDGADIDQADARGDVGDALAEAPAITIMCPASEPIIACDEAHLVGFDCYAFKGDRICSRCFHGDHDYDLVPVCPCTWDTWQAICVLDCSSCTPGRPPGYGADDAAPPSDAASAD